MALEWAYLDQKNVVGAEIASGIHATILNGLFLGLDSDGNAVLADKTSGADQIAARGAAYGDGTYGTTDLTKNKERISIVRTGKLDGFTGLTPGVDCYLNSGGGITQVEPTTPGDLKQVVAFALTDEAIWVDVHPAEVLT
jgi:hypothetical protein